MIELSVFMFQQSLVLQGGSQSRERHIMALVILVPLIVLVGSASSGPIYPLPLTYVALSSIPENIYNQVQDTKSGEYAFGYGGGPVAREEARTSDGVTRGAYSYVDAHGIVQYYRYVADDDGFRVVGTNIPTEVAFNGRSQPQQQSQDVNVEAINAENSSEKSVKIASGRKKRSANHDDIPLVTINSLPVASVPIATSSQSHVQIHRSLKADIHNLIETIPTESLAIVSETPITVKTIEAVPLANTAAVPIATWSQSRYQIHNSVKTEFHEPVEAFPVETVVREVLPATIPVTAASVPISTSSESSYQIHNSARTELHQPVEAIPIKTVTAIPETPVTLPAAIKSIETIPATPETKIADHTPQVAVQSKASQSTPVPANAEQASIHDRLHNGAKFEFEGLPRVLGHELVEFQPTIGFQPINEFSHPSLARHRIGVGLGVVPSPFVAYPNYQTALFIEA